MMGVCSARITAADDPLSQAHPRRICTGTTEQILEDLQGFADEGYSLVVCFFDCPSGELSELEDQMQRLVKALFLRPRRYSRREAGRQTSKAVVGWVLPDPPAIRWLTLRSHPLYDTSLSF